MGEGGRLGHGPRPRLLPHWREGEGVVVVVDEYLVVVEVNIGGHHFLLMLMSM